MDQGRTDDPEWRRIFQGYEPARDMVSRAAPDVAVIIYNDHGSAFGLDALPTFALGVAPTYMPADEGWGPRPIPPIHGDPELSWHLAESLIADHFDLTVCQHLNVDHGLTVPMSIAWGAVQQWPVKIIPIAVNVIQYPMPSPRRCFELGRAIARAIESFPKAHRVAVIGTGGMSHQLSGERAGLINERFDKHFLDKIVGDWDELVDMTTLDYIREAGSEGAELIMWLTMRGATPSHFKSAYTDYHIPASNTAAGIVALTN
jgi:protocatechuate 4,5-dioxygenase beta chain